MQESLSLASGLFTVEKVIETPEWRIPSEVTSYLHDYRVASTRGGVFDLSAWGTVEIKGKDARDYLHRMTTANFKNFDDEGIAHGAFLTGRGLVVSLGMFRRTEEGFLFFVPPGHAAAAAEHIEKFHFAEAFTVADVSTEWALFGLWSPENRLSSLNVYGLYTANTPLRVEAREWNGVSLEVWRDDSRESLFWVKLKRSDAEAFLSAVQAAEVSLLGQRVFDYFRIRANVPQVGIEATEKEIILETGYERAVARNKGCYPGQEVVERIYTYGSVNRKLQPVTLTRDGVGQWPSMPLEILAGEAAAGQVASIAEEPENSVSAIGLAFVRKQFWERRESFSAANGVSVTLR